MLVGGAGAACRPPGEPAAPRSSAAPARISGESFAVCHALRDRAAPTTTAPTAEHDVVIVGGGPSGLVAAHRLRDREVLLLEKEATLGGNCTLDEWAGVTMATGAAFYTDTEEEVVALLAELGVQGGRIAGTDALVVEGEAVRDFFQAGAADLPFARAVRDDFRRSREDLLRLYRTTPPEVLDARPFSELLAPYAGEVRRFWDRFGRSNWGADAAGTSGFVGCEAYTWAGGAEERRTFPGGLAGAARALAASVTRGLGERVVTGAAVHRIEVVGAGADARAQVHYLVDGAPRAVRARAVVVALPKLIARRVVVGLPEAQAAAFERVRYAPYPVFNVCLHRPGPEPAYDSWCLDTPFTDFVVADWVVHGGPGPAQRRTALTVYHPLAEAERGRLLVADEVLALADGVADGLERHFPGTLAKIAEVRVHRRGHAMSQSSPGRMAWAEAAARPFGPITFAHTDLAAIASFSGAVEAAEIAVHQVRRRLGLPT